MMLVTVVSGLIFTKKRNLIEIQIFPESVRKLWNEWELRTMVLLSLSLQIVLILLGNRRKYISKNWVRIILWLAYLSADWVATVSLGILSNNEGDSKDNSLDSNYIIMAFWAPFLLVHLGGPDTISAYSLEDNELWLRHLLGLVVQFGVAFYIFLRSWTGTPLNVLAIPMFMAGLIKYGERTWVLRSASSDHFRDSMLPRPDPGPNYAKFMDEYSSKKAEGYKISLGTVIEAPTVMAHSHGDAINDIMSDEDILHNAYYFFSNFKRLFADLILSFQDRENSMAFFQNISSDNAFRVIEVELGFMFDVLYTKADIIYSPLGSFLRSISLSSTVSVFIAFLIIDKNKYFNVNVSITCLLLVGAIVLEIYAVIVLISSDWTMLWLSKQKNPLLALTYQAFSSCRSRSQSSFLLPANKRWSNSMEQYNLMSFCLEDKPAKCSGIQKFFCIYQMLEKHRYKNSEVVPADLKKLIFEKLLEKSKSATDIGVCKQLCTHRGDRVLKETNCLDKLGWSVEVEFDQSILLWHIATDLCYYINLNKNPNTVENLKCKMSKMLSDYMLYLLVMCPSMLPNGIGQIRFEDTCAEAIEFFQERKRISNGNQACTMLLRVNTEILPSKVKGDRSKSVLFDACRLAKSLQSLETDDKWESEKKWEMMSHVWVEMLSYAASQCRWNYHAKQLRRGGELLTHVWLLMAHLGITEQFQISQGHARAKLLVS